MALWDGRRTGITALVAPALSVSAAPYSHQYGSQSERFSMPAVARTRTTIGVARANPKRQKIEAMSASRMPSI